jgi:UDPglucose 6-dehydrogenase
MKIGIIGYGIVGKATEKTFTSGHDVVIFSIDRGSFNDLLQCDLVFICMPTNNLDDLDTLRTYCSKLLMPVIIRSTVTPGFTSSLSFNIMYMPEFLRERCWEKDCITSYKVLGSNYPVDSNLLKILHYPQVIPTAEAELLKMMSNVFSSLKITFANHMYNYSNAIGADYRVIKDLLEKTYTNQDYLEVNENLRGFGGKCLPKDLDLILHEMSKHKLEQTLLTSIKNDNELWPTTIRED